jgi:hypothetical protein
VIITAINRGQEFSFLGTACSCLASEVDLLGVAVGGAVDAEHLDGRVVALARDVTSVPVGQFDVPDRVIPSQEAEAAAVLHLGVPERSSYQRRSKGLFLPSGHT